MATPEERELEHLKTKSNPFDTRVMQPGTEEDTLASTVIEWFGDHLNLMAKVVEKYRTTERQKSQVLWITGNPGTGKSTMMLAFQEKMTTFGKANSRPTLIFRAEGSLLQRDPSDFLLSEIYNRLVSRSGNYVLSCLSSRLCATYLKASILALPDNERPYFAKKLDKSESVESLKGRCDRFLERCSQPEPYRPGDIHGPRCLAD